MMLLMIYTLLSVAMFFLGSRALITQAIWRHYPRGFAQFMDCPSCVGFWWGCIWALGIGRRLEIDVGPLSGLDPATPLLVGLCTLVLTPIVAGIMQWGLNFGGHIEIDDYDVDVEDTTPTRRH